MILITGAAGYIGSKLVHFFLDQDIPIRAIDNFRVHPMPKMTGATIHKMDVTVRDDVKEMVKGVDTIIHLGAISDVSQCETHADEAIQVNLLSMQYLMSEATKAGVRKVIFPSSFAVYDPHSERITEQTRLKPVTFYGHMKKWAEELLLAEQAKGTLDVVIFRQSNVYGKGWVSKTTVIENFCRSLLNNQPITIYGSGQQTRNFIHLDDVAWAYYRALSPSVQGVYNLGGEETYSIFDLAHLVNQVGQESIGRSVPIIRKHPQPIEEKKTHFTTLDRQKLKSLFRNRKMKSVKTGIHEYLREST
ncbi:NAD-dependent epimerase/dehydratase family protein [Paludifilum halophilum]|uniref:NAD-dependent epimerase/dehydratase domain-containing protein n=1 Tax=Paludifilum halophilum TaxID=1642702 RepID=A0A235BBI9_9BACL|nr:NAD(P)-dependent oxidoreductase [Paludifilum halophilum]OYD09678.1 hypothetical protein CHM34_01340 [Paludifilum halophilum]